MRKHLAAALAFVLAAGPVAAAEDVIVLENGREARGRIVEETDAGVSLDIGGGKMFYAKSRIKEIRRDAPDPKPAAAAATPANPADSREEYGLLYQDGRRVGTRVFRVAKAADGFRFEEELVFLDAKGVPEMQVRTMERADANLLPLAFQVRESAGESEHKLTVGEVRGGRLYLVVTKQGEKSLSDEVLPAGARFPSAAREMFLRDSKALAGKLTAQVFDTRDQRWRTTAYAEGGTRPVVENGQAMTLRVVTRRRGDVNEREWVDDRLVSHMSELNGESLRSIGSTMDVVGRVRKGDTDRVTGPDSAARTVYADAEGGWKIGKPDPSWTFEVPPVRGAGALLSIRNAPLFASVDVLQDVKASPDTTLERAAESLQRLCRTVAEDFRVVADGYTGEGPARVYWLEATATTKGEKTKTLAHVVVRNGRVYRLLAACPEGAFATLRPELEKILGSFAVD
jgi:hypothetical protein